MLFTCICSIVMYSLPLVMVHSSPAFPAAVQGDGAGIWLRKGWYEESDYDHQVGLEISSGFHPSFYWENKGNSKGLLWRYDGNIHGTYIGFNGNLMVISCLSVRSQWEDYGDDIYIYIYSIYIYTVYIYIQYIYTVYIYIYNIYIYIVQWDV